MQEQINDLGLVRQIDHQAHRLAHAAPARQVRGRERVEPPVRAKQQQLVGGLGVEHEPRPSPSLNFSSASSAICPFIARIQPICEQTTVIGSFSIIASSGTSSTSAASAKVVRRAPPW